MVQIACFERKIEFVELFIWYYLSWLHLAQIDLIGSAGLVDFVPICYVEQVGPSSTVFVLLIAHENASEHFAGHLVGSGLVLGRDRVVQDLCPERNDGASKFASKTLFIRCLAVHQDIKHISYKTKIHHGVRPPWF